MSQQQRWPKPGSETELQHKLGENIWWLIVLAERSCIDIKEAVAQFLGKTEMSYVSNLLCEKRSRK